MSTEETKYADLPEEAHRAVHAARDHAQAIETARQVQLEEAVEKTALRTKSDMLDALREVFATSDENKDPKQMSILIQRIPLLCLNIEQMHNDISELKDSQKWAVRIVVGLFIAAVAKMVFLP